MDNNESDTLEQGCSTLLDSLYSDRVDYTIVALTGYTGTGCSRIAELMSKNFSNWPDLRKPEDLTLEKPDICDNDDLMYTDKTNHSAIAGTVFARKYTICYNYAQTYYEPFTIIKYSHVLIFYTLKYLIREISKKEQSEDSKDQLKSFLSDILKDKYRPSRKKEDDNYRTLRKKDSKLSGDFSYSREGEGNFKWEEVHNLSGLNFNEWDTLIKELDQDSVNSESNKEDIKKEAKLFFKQGCFKDFVKAFNNYLWKIDPYCTHFFYHRLGFVIRATGNPSSIAHDVMGCSQPQGEHLYDIVKLINRLIKGYRYLLEEDHKDNFKKPCRIVIDKIRNSLEAKFLKERYAAFYFIALHEEKEVLRHLKKRLEQIYKNEEERKNNKDLTNLQLNKIIALDLIEREGKDFEEGKFFAHNLSQCIADAEIHISNDEGSGENRNYFYSMSEQWMKYATLIQHPGLITPSSEERCMVVAYTAKFNSGCLSRQVGAVITNKAHTIRSIGWNDVPYGQIPCSLRELTAMATDKDSLKIRRYVYSDYETGETKKFKDGETFCEKVRGKYETLHLDLSSSKLMQGLPWSYCFKSLQNEFEQEKNQVHTRSLHAEENAILQMAKYGGEALYQGIIYVTASPCELCCKKLYQIGVRKIVYIDEYPGISRENIITIGYHRPKLKQFQGAYGSTYFKLYQPILAYKDELKIRRSEVLNTDYNKEFIKAATKIIADNLKGKIVSEEELKKKLKELEDKISIGK